MGSKRSIQRSRGRVVSRTHVFKLHKSSKTSYARIKEPPMRHLDLSEVPSRLPKAGVLVHNWVHAQWEDQRPGRNGFRVWTEPKPKTGRPLCQCGWSGLPHYRTTGLGIAGVPSFAAKNFSAFTVWLAWAFDDAPPRRYCGIFGNIRHSWAGAETSFALDCLYLPATPDCRSRRTKVTADRSTSHPAPVVTGKRCPAWMLDEDAKLRRKHKAVRDAAAARRKRGERSTPAVR